MLKYEFILIKGVLNAPIKNVCIFPYKIILGKKRKNERNYSSTTISAYLYAQSKI